MSGKNKRKTVLLPRSVEDDSLTEQDDTGKVVAVVIAAPYHEYNASSPDSTASGPTYEPRRPGFEHHAHQEVSKYRRSNGLEFAKQVGVNQKVKKILEPPLPKNKTKREPLPMKLRALPQSFWQQPNQPAMSPGAAYPVLPPLTSACGDESPEETLHEPLLVSPANTELLFSLFLGIEEDPAASRPPVIRRGRPRKAPSQLMAKVLKDDDPCLGSAAGHAALPLLMPPLCNPQTSPPPGTLGCRDFLSGPHQMVAMMPLRENERSSLTLPSLSGVDQSYSQLLSELVVRL